MNSRPIKYQKCKTRLLSKKLVQKDWGEDAAPYSGPLDNPDSYTSRENLKDPGEMPRAGIIR